MIVTMEPCSTRLSGNISCSDSILQWNIQNKSNMIREILVGVLEPLDFVVCEGRKRLEEHGVRVRLVEGFEDECLRIARQK